MFGGTRVTKYTDFVLYRPSGDEPDSRGKIPGEQFLYPAPVLNPQPFPRDVDMTRFIAAYDTEMAGECLAACHRIRDVHLEFDAAATFFIVGERLQEEGRAYRTLLGDAPAFEIASHTYSHKMLRDHPFCGPAPDRKTRLEELRLGRHWVEETFGRPCAGLRPGCGFARGLRGDPWLIEAVMETGFEYVSSVLWGPETSLPALLEAPSTYAEDGFPTLWELPGHGWHENLLKAHNLTDRVQRILAWPPAYPEAIPARPIATPEEEFAVHRIFIDRAVAMELPYVSLILHPWSLARFDPDMTMLRLLFAHLRTAGIPTTTYEAEWKRVAQPHAAS